MISNWTSFIVNIPVTQMMAVYDLFIQPSLLFNRNWTHIGLISVWLLIETGRAWQIPFLKNASSHILISLLNISGRKIGTFVLALAISGIFSLRINRYAEEMRTKCRRKADAMLTKCRRNRHKGVNQVKNY